MLDCFPLTILSYGTVKAISLDLALECTLLWSPEEETGLRHVLHCLFISFFSIFISFISIFPHPRSSDWNKFLFAFVTIDRDLVNVSECFPNLTTVSLTALCKALGILEILPDPEMKESFC